ncbi:MAG: hypothetical protein FWE82_10660, partial [Defluviitaleaceae bacterium]|nr:hypothetical protein [Defluviitaleaceae bacterium]
MKKKRRGFFFRFNFFLTILLFSQNCNLLLHANANIPLDAKAAVLIEFTTGKILFEKDSDLKIYPASMTKMMTALVALDYLTTDQIFIVGDEIFALAGNLMRAGHQVGESVCVMTLLNLLLIRSGNETACVLALNTAKAAAGKNMAYQEAEKIFCRLMNEKARKIGAVNTNFTNPHGGHNDEHYSTAYDISLISRA